MLLSLNKKGHFWRLIPPPGLLEDGVRVLSINIVGGHASLRCALICGMRLLFSADFALHMLNLVCYMCALHLCDANNMSAHAPNLLLYPTKHPLIKNWRRWAKNCWLVWVFWLLIAITPRLQCTEENTCNRCAFATTAPNVPACTTTASTRTLALTSAMIHTFVFSSTFASS